jgi:hypothetical protein
LATQSGKGLSKIRATNSLAERRISVLLMREDTKKRWNELCRQAVAEIDPEKLKLINREIDRILNDQEDDLKRRQQSADFPGSAAS